MMAKRFKQILLLYLFPVIFLSFSGCQQTPEVNTISDTDGISDDTILIGSSSALTGHIGFLGREYIKGARLYFDEVNRKGGINGRHIQLISLDDQYEPARTVSNTQELIQQHRVFCLFNYVGTPTTMAVKEIIEEARIPTIGLLTGAHSLRIENSRSLPYPRFILC